MMKLMKAKVTLMLILVGNEVHARGTFAVCSCVNMEHPIHAFKQYEKLAKYQRLERKLYKSENELKKH